MLLLFFLLLTTTDGFVLLGSSRLRKASSLRAYEAALLFDCDGVIVETEELHRLAYNAAFEAFDLKIDGEKVDWSVSYYDMLQNTVGGGKPKMRFHFTETAKKWPASKSKTPTTLEEGLLLIDELQDYKTKVYKTLVLEACPRPGILKLMDAAIATPNLAVGICSASTRGGFETVVDAVLGHERLQKMDIIIAGDDVKEKKPSPEIYDLAATKLNLKSEDCLVIEDSIVGLKAAKAAHMRCCITYTPNTASADFYAHGADAKVADFSTFDNNAPEHNNPIDAFFELKKNRLHLKTDLLANIKDPPTR